MGAEFFAGPRACIVLYSECFVFTSWLTMGGAFETEEKKDRRHFTVPLDKSSLVSFGFHQGSLSFVSGWSSSFFSSDFSAENQENFP